MLILGSGMYNKMKLYFDIVQSQQCIVSASKKSMSNGTFFDWKWLSYEKMTCLTWYSCNSMLYSNVRRMPLDSIDPSLAFGFYCHNRGMHIFQLCFLQQFCYLRNVAWQVSHWRWKCSCLLLQLIRFLNTAVLIMCCAQQKSFMTFALDHQSWQSSQMGHPCSQ